MKKLFPLTAVLLLLSLWIPGFSQGLYTNVTGTVTDSTGALIPGVTITATAVETGVVTTILTNEAGAYTFANLLPGKYRISASLTGFQTKTLTDLDLSQNTSYRFNIELSVSSVNTQVEVTIAADTIMATSTGTVGQVLSQEKVQNLPFVGNNILDLITVMAGVENIVPTNPPNAANAFGRDNTTFAGVRADNVSVVRDGIQMQDVRSPNGIYSITTVNQDLVGEIRLILAPVDVEMGRGNGSIQYTTRSGTNRFAGSAVWSVRNTALDPNTWTNNRNQTIPQNQAAGTLPKATPRNWTNTNQVTVSYGGPIVRNKTFFFALYDFNAVRSRTLENFIVLTPCARLGIYRYFNGWNNGNVNFGADTTGSTATRVSVNLDGTPRPPSGLPVGSTLVLPQPYDNSLKAVSVFGPLASQPTKSDCSDAAINPKTLVPNGVVAGAAPGGGGGWDRYRSQLDPSGFISRSLAFYPTPNNYEVGDGLNTAGYRYLRPSRGVDNLFGSGEATGDRRQYNLKIDHNFTDKHKGNVNVSYERVDSDDVLKGLPGMFSNLNYRRPIVISGAFTSTLSPTLLNEARFGMRQQGINVVAPWHRPEYNEELQKFFPPDVNGFRVIPRNFNAFNMCQPHSGGRPPTGTPAAGGSTCINITGTSYETTPTYTFSDTLSWSHGKHSFRFNGELRLSSSQTRTPTTGGFGSVNSTFMTVSGGSITGTTAGNTSATDISGTNPAMPGLIEGTNGNGTNARALLSFLAGSVGNVQSLYYISDPNKIDAWSDYRTAEFINIKTVQREFSAWAKDEWKVTKSLTLTPGLRWDYYGVPYLASGLTVAPVGGGASAFGISGRDFTGWMNPGVRGELTNTEFVGGNSPHPGKGVRSPIYHNFGPSLAFAWQLPWLGQGKTTVRGGYQITYQADQRFGAIAGALSNAPGGTLSVGYTTQNVYLDMTNLNTAIPLSASVLPLQPLATSGPRQANFSAFDPNYTSPYVQNLTLSVTRSLNRQLTVDVRYIGTLSKKNYTTLNLNTNNFLYNGLLDVLERVRTGTEITKTASDPKSLLDRMFNGVNLCTSAASPNSGSCTTGQPYGAIGSTVNGVYQSAAYQMRSSTTFQSNLANGAYNTIAGTLDTLNYATSGSNASLPPVGTNTVGAVMRLNGFPDNFISTNPQFNNMNLFTNSGYSNYHSLQVQLTSRPFHGLSGQATYNWSKNLGLLTTLTNPVDRALDYTNINNNPGHTLRTNGILELPIGPNKLLLPNSSGWLARAVERWQLGLIYNLSSGAPQTITATSMLYGNGVPDVRHPVDFNKLKELRWGTRGTAFLEGRYFDNNDVFVKVDDPLCGTVTNAQNLSGLAPTTGAATRRCTLSALAMVVQPGTPDSQLLSDGRTVQIVLQHPQPGKKGNLGNNSVIGLGVWRFDANLGKTFRVTESTSFQIRFDAQNVLNHPQPGGPNLSITGTAPFGQVTTKTGERILQAQARLNF